MFDNASLINETDRLSKFAYRLTHNASDAEDLLQATLLRAIEKQHLFKEDTNLYSWVSKIMFNLFVSTYRRKTKFETQYDPEPYIEAQSINASQEKKMEVKDVSIAMDQLSDQHKDILVKICVEGASYAQVADELSIPVGTVRSRLSRARDNLQEALEENAGLDASQSYYAGESHVYQLAA